MKILKKILKQEKGSITMTVVALMLFITTGIFIAYFSLSNQSNDQSKKTRQVADSYKVTNSDLIQKYKDVLENLNEVTTMSITEVKSLGNTMLTKGTNTVVNDELGNNFVVPAGFKVTDDANNLTQGMVIQDKNGNEWVWIPVSSEDLAKMYVEDDTGWTMAGTDIITKYKTINATLGEYTLERLNPGEKNTHSTYKEPDLLDVADTNQEFQLMAGFNDLTSMATELRNDYKNMIDSIRKNKGFYVGRYELSGSIEQPLEKKYETVLNSQNWYNLYKSCKKFTSKNVESRMIWGCQWDQVCRFINEFGEKVSLDDSTTYGNFNNSSGNANITGKGSRNTTGFSEYWKVNNIYDFAGNCWEYTQEAFNYSGTDRSRRGRSL